MGSGGDGVQDSLGRLSACGLSAPFADAGVSSPPWSARTATWPLLPLPDGAALWPLLPLADGAAWPFRPFADALASFVTPD